MNGAIWQIPLCTRQVSHNAPFCSKMCTHVHISVKKNGVLRDMERVHRGICAAGLLKHYIGHLCTFVLLGVRDIIFKVAIIIDFLALLGLVRVPGAWVCLIHAIWWNSWCFRVFFIWWIIAFNIQRGAIITRLIFSKILQFIDTP